jgi:DNA-binding NarL/FixJ family response regulator
MLILVVDDHPLVCAALEMTLVNGLSDCAVKSAQSVAEALSVIETHDLDLALLDLKLPDASGLDGLERLRKAAPRLPIIVISALDDTRLMPMVRSMGASGFISKTAKPRDIFEAIHVVLDGGAVFPQNANGMDMNCPEARRAEEIHLAAAMHSLTPQQRVVLRMLGEGLLNKQIAYELSISESTVKGHVSAILRKFEVPSRMQAVLLAQRTMFDQALGA